MDNFRGSSAFYKKYQKHIKFSPKQVNSQSQVILASGEFNRYIELQNHKKLIDTAEKYGVDNCLCESRQNCRMANLFFDYDCKDQLSTFPDAMNTIDALKAKIKAIFPQLIVKFYVKDSLEPDNDELINSLHIITHLSTPDGYSVYFDYSNGCSQIKHFVSKLDLEHPFDHKQAYSGHLLRLLHSNKFDKQGNLTNRIFNESDMSDIQDEPLKSLSSYCPNPKFMLVTDYINSNFILQYVKNHEYSKNYLFEHIKQRDNESHLSLTLTEQHTPLCEHKSNNAVCMLYNNSDNPNIIIKCQDEECGKFVQTFFRYDHNTHRCQIITTGDNSSDRQQSSPSRSSNSQSSSNSVTPVKNTRQNNADKRAKNTAQHAILDMSQETHQHSGFIIDNVDHLEENGYSAEASPPSNDLFKALFGNQKCSFIGKDNYHHYTINGTEHKIKFSKSLIKGLQQLSRRYDREELLNMGIVFNQYNYYNNCNNTTINIQTNKEDTVYDDDFDTIEFQSDQHREYFVNIINDEFQFITELYNLEFPDQFIYVYDETDRGCAMYFDNFDKTRKITTNGGYWNIKGGIQVAKQRVRNYIVDYFKSIMKQIDDPKDPRRKLIQIKLKSVRNVLKNNTELDQYLYETFFQKDIQFNNYPHLLHFQNGTFDLDQRKFIKTTPDMYNIFQINYDFDETVPYDEIYQQLSQIMQPDEFDWLLKQFSNCLNPNKVIEEKQIVVLIGFGDNGKTILSKLMTHALGTQAYAYNGRHHMVQTQNSSSSNATPDFAKLINKRFCYIAELEKNIAFNQQQVKILTGGEEIQARDLYKSLITFQPSAGIFISCNQIPYIDTSDGGFLNRLKIIDLKYKFVENPTNKFQKPINKQLQSLIKTTPWKQGFINMMIQYYYKKQIKIPKSIQLSIKSRISLQQSSITLWASENLEYKEDSYVMADDIWQQFKENNSNKIGKISFNKQVNEFFLQRPNDYNGITYEFIDINKKDVKARGMGFNNCGYKQNLLDSHTSENFEKVL